MKIVDCSVGVNFLAVRLSDGRTVTCPMTPRLRKGTTQEVMTWRLIGGGSGIHWPALDEDLSLREILTKVY